MAAISPQSPLVFGVDVNTDDFERVLPLPEAPFAVGHIEDDLSLWKVQFKDRLDDRGGLSNDKDGFNEAHVK